MRVSGKVIVFGMLAVSLGLCWWVRMIAPRPGGVSVHRNAVSHGHGKPGYRTKEFPSMEQSRAIAEKAIDKNSPYKNIITMAKPHGDGWMFFYETEKYLNSGNPADRITDNPPIIVHQDGTTEMLVDEKK